MDPALINIHLSLPTSLDRFNIDVQWVKSFHIPLDHQAPSGSLMGACGELFLSPGHPINLPSYDSPTINLYQVEASQQVVIFIIDRTLFTV
jgi:hypothetical protein